MHFVPSRDDGYRCAHTFVVRQRGSDLRPVPWSGRRGCASMRLWPRLASSAFRAASSEAAPGGSGSGTSRL